MPMNCECIQCFFRLRHMICHLAAISASRLLFCFLFLARIGSFILNSPGNMYIYSIPLIPNFYVIQFGYTGVYICFLISDCNDFVFFCFKNNLYIALTCFRNAFVLPSIGVCFPGWLGHSSYCYQFNVQYRMSFDGATTYCKNQGAELLRYRR